jgi:hypothetical protein
MKVVDHTYGTSREMHRQYIGNFTKKLPLYMTTRALNQNWKMTGITLTQEVSSYLEILKVSRLQLKTLAKYTPALVKSKTHLPMNIETRYLTMSCAHRQKNTV